MDWKKLLRRLPLQIPKLNDPVIETTYAGFSYQRGHLYWSHSLTPDHGPIYTVVYIGPTSGKEQLTTSISCSLGSSPLFERQLALQAWGLTWYAEIQTFEPSLIHVQLGESRIRRICTVSGVHPDDVRVVDEMLLFVDSCIGLDNIYMAYVALRTEAVPSERRPALRLALSRIMTAFEQSATQSANRAYA